VSRYTVTDSTARGIGTIEKEVTVSYAARLIRPGQAAALAGLLLRARRRAAGRADVLGPLPRPSGSAPIRFLPTTMPGDSHPMRFHFHFRTLATLALAAVVLSGCTDSVQAGIFRRRPAPAPAACSGGTCRQYQYQAVHACRPAVAAVPAGNLWHRQPGRVPRLAERDAGRLRPAPCRVGRRAGHVGGGQQCRAGPPRTRPLHHGAGPAAEQRHGWWDRIHVDELPRPPIRPA
jgi:hypothetical protein